MLVHNETMSSSQNISKTPSLTTSRDTTTALPSHSKASTTSPLYLLHLEHTAASTSRTTTPGSTGAPESAENCREDLGTLLESGSAEVSPLASPLSIIPSIPPGELAAMVPIRKDRLNENNLPASNAHGNALAHANYQDSLILLVKQLADSYAVSYHQDLLLTSATQRNAKKERDFLYKLKRIIANHVATEDPTNLDNPLANN